MKNQIKVQTKKAISLFLAVLMVLSAWVWVAPEKAEAAAGQYYVKVYVNVEKYSEKVSSPKITVNYNKNNGKGESGSTYQNPATSQFSSNGNDRLMFSGWVDGFPTSANFYCYLNKKLGGTTLRVGYLRMYVGKDESSCNNLIAGNRSKDSMQQTAYSTGGNKEFDFSITTGYCTDNTDDYTKKDPVASSVASAPSAQTISVPTTGDASKTFTATFKDQYGVDWIAAHDGLTAELSPSVGTVSVSNNVATVKAKIGVFDELSNYSSSTGKGSAKLNVKFGNATTSCTVTFQAPQYTISFKDHAGNTNSANDKKYYYGANVNNIVPIAPSNSHTQIEGDDVQHQNWVWNIDDIDKVVKDVTVSEIQDVKENHSGWSALVVTVPAKCSASGEGYRTCADCGYKKYEKINSLDHTEVVIPAKAATCYESGSTEGKKCSSCGLILTSPEEVPMVDHDYEWKTIAPTCVYKGYEEGTCKNCSHTTKRNPVDPVGHKDEDPVKENEVLATCTKPGSYDMVVYCATCRERLYYTPYTVPALQHSFEGEVTLAPGCETEGVMTYTCSRNCGEEGHTYTEVIPALGHEWDDGSVKKAPTCTVPGVKTATCQRCKITSEVSIDPLGHKYDNGTVTKQPSCLDKGEKTYKCTLNCGEAGNTYTEEIDSLGHNHVPTVIAPTCTEYGHTVHKCSRCDDEYITDQTAPLGHNETAVVTPPTCNDRGFTTHTCSRCDYVKVDTYVPALGHDMQLDPDKTSVEATCSKPGEAYYKCTRCSETEIRKTSKLPHKAGEELIENKKPASCTETGYYDRVVRCNVCNEVVSSVHVTVPKTEHQLADDWTVTQDPTCIAYGYREKKCAKCSFVKRETIAKVPHVDGGNLTKTDAVEATCQTAGNIEYFKCADCRKVYINTAAEDAEAVYEVYDGDVQVPALGHVWTEHHDYDKIKIKATCQTPAVYYNYCDRCQTQLYGTNQTHEFGGVDADAHVFEGDMVTATSKESGHTFKCTVPGCTESGAAVYCRFEVIKDVASTCKDKGYTVYACECCYSYTEEKELSTEHGELVDVDRVESTCSKPGSVGGKQCTVCEQIFDSKEIIPVDPSKHENMLEFEAKDATCQIKGNKAYSYCDACNTYQDENGNACKWADLEIPATGNHVFTTFEKDADADTHTALCDTCIIDEANNLVKAKKTLNCYGGVATCSTKATCSVCTEKYGSLNPDKHESVNTIPAVAATCQTSGKTAYEYCSTCKTNVTVPEDVDKLPHEFTEWEQTEVKGVKSHTRYCKKCVKGEGLTVEKETFACSGGVATCIEEAKCSVCSQVYAAKDPANHASTGTKVVGTVESTCTQPGYTGDEVHTCCYVDGMDLADEANANVIVKLGEPTEQEKHDYSTEGVRVASTCITNGYVTYKCSVCDDPEMDGEEVKKNELPLDSKNHVKDENGEYYKTEKKNVKDVTCVEDGYTGDIYCARCYNDAEGANNADALLEQGEVIESAGQHVYCDPTPEYLLTKTEDGKISVDEDGAPVLKATVSYEDKVKARHSDNKWYHVVVCAECGDEVYTACYTYTDTSNCADTSVCNVCSGLCSLKTPTKHKNELTAVAEVPATCQGNGKKEYYTCADCNKKFYDAAGRKVVEKDSDLIIPLAPHNIDWDNGEVVKEAACGENGQTKYSCKTENCTYSVTLSDISSNGVHEWGEEHEVIVPATCYKSGYMAIKCTVCGEGQSGSYLTINKIDHVYDEGVVTVEPSCEGVGTKVYTCVNADKGCKATYTEILDALEHDWDDGVVTTEPSCGENGVLTFTCGNCSKTKTEVIPATEEHTPDESAWKVTREPTCLNSGVKQTTCISCSKVYVVSIPATGEHTPVIVPGQEPTCSVDGYTDYVVCDVCGKCLEGGEILPADPDNEANHKDYNGDGHCDSCDRELWDNGDCGCICHKTNGFMQFIYKILKFFWKLFGITKTCDCGATHY